jgi:hypothetical protein
MTDMFLQGERSERGVEKRSREEKRAVGNVSKKQEREKKGKREEGRRERAYRMLVGLLMSECISSTVKLRDHRLTRAEGERGSCFDQIEHR